MKILSYIKEMRVHHYIKNLLVFLPLACSGQITDTARLFPALYGFAAFCFISSAVYIINDIRDIEKDRNNEAKRSRPIAAGEIPVKNAVILAVFLVILTAAMCFLSGRVPESAAIVLLYLVLNISYSLGLKNVPVLDIIILVSGFFLRVILGSIVTGISISNWLYLVVLSTSFFLGLGKRRSELKSIPEESRRDVLKKYPLVFLENNMYVFMALTVIFYALWATDSNVAVLHGTDKLIWSVPVVITILMKYSLAVEGGKDGDPVEVFLHDKVLMILSAVYLVIMFFLLYF